MRTFHQETGCFNIMDIENIVTDLITKIEKRFYGKYRGIVVDNEDPEQLGRLKLKIPSVLGSEITSGWAMPCTPFGGMANQGILFIPEIDAGVWVEFEEGDCEFPIWVGTFWSKPDGETELPKPNEPDGSEQDSVQDPITRKIIKTVKGHTIQLEDADGDESIIITDGVNGHVITLNSEGIHILDGTNDNDITCDDSGILITDGPNAQSIVFNSDGIKIEDTNGNTLTMASDSITMESAADVKITGANITIEASGTLEAKGSLIHLNP